MFTRKGNARTRSHIIQLASLLSFVAGMVNMAGFLWVGKMVSHVTGHVSLFANATSQLNGHTGLVYFFCLFFFFAGSFYSSFVIEKVSRWNAQYVYLIPVLSEVAVLVAVTWVGIGFPDLHSHGLAYGLLFAMGLQNSLVTRISKAVVRTTHLTGLVTDLGIELSQLFFYTNAADRDKLLSSMRLRFVIVGCFVAGGMCSGVLYPFLQAKVLFMASACLCVGVVYDTLKYRVIKLRRVVGIRVADYRTRLVS